MAESGFEMSGTFNEDYLWFYEHTLTEERNRAEADEILTTLDLPEGASILDAPCGHGRIANLLAGAGHRVVGVDILPLFLERARADAADAGVEVDYRPGDLRELPVDGPFDAVICWFTSFGYFDDAGNRAVLDEFARVLRPGGTLLIEMMHHDGFVRNHAAAPEAIVTERGDDLLIDVSTFDPVLGRVDTERTTVRDGAVKRTSYFVRLPTVPELDGWLAAAGFEERAYHDRGGAPLTCESWRLVATAIRAG